MKGIEWGTSYQYKRTTKIAGLACGEAGLEDGKVIDDCGAACRMSLLGHHEILVLGAHARQWGQGEGRETLDA